MAAEFYIGKVCAKHLELRGQRYASNKKCPKCERVAVKAWTAKNPGHANASTKAWRAKNPGRANAHSKTWKEANPKRAKEATKTWLKANSKHASSVSRKYRYGITETQYQALIALQNNCCAICMSSANGKTLHIDHDHATGKVRSLLCNSCNHLLGNAKEAIGTLKAAIKYLRKHSK